MALADAMNYTTSGFFVLRTPLLPFDAWLDWGSEGRAHSSAVVEGRPGLRAALFAKLRRREVAEALFIAYAGLHERALSTAGGADAGAEKLDRTLTRYFSRMSARATPFGLFAGCSVGRLAARTALRLRACTEHARHTRLDMDYLCALIEGVEREPAIHEHRLE